MVSGEFFEAGNSRGQSAKVECQSGELLLVTSCFSRTFKPDALGVSQRLAQLPRRIHFPDGSMFSTTHNEQVDQVLVSLGRPPKSHWIHFFEAGWRWALLAMLVIPLVLFLLFTFGMPLVAAPMAAMVSTEIKGELDRQAIEWLDSKIFEPSELGLQRQEELTEKFSRASFGQEDDKLLFRGGGFVGANALALPGGTIIFTDEIVELADYDGELVAVYLHEVGHVAGNHALRNVIQTAGVSFVLGWMLGDLTMITDVVLVGAPVFLQKLAYSRRFEREADAYAMALIPLSGYSKNCFADMMKKLSTQNARQLHDVPDYLSSHPPTRQRINMSRSAQPCSEYRSNHGPEAPVSDKAKIDRLIRQVATVRMSPPEFHPDLGEIDEQDLAAGDSEYLPIQKVTPAYPVEALTQGIGGVCVIEYTVTSLGAVEDPTVVEDQCTSTLFIAPSIEASLKFRYRPRISDSQVVDTTGVRIKFIFEIMPYSPEDEET